MTRNVALSPMMDMESAVSDVRRWAMVLTHIATSDDCSQGEELHVVANALRNLGRDLEAKWKRAFEAAGGEA